MSNFQIKGERIILTPIKPNQKELFYQLATDSYGGFWWYDCDRISKPDFKKRIFY